MLVAASCWIIAMFRQHYCLSVTANQVDNKTAGANPVKAMCYSDIATYYPSQLAQAAAAVLLFAGFLAAVLTVDKISQLGNQKWAAIMLAASPLIVLSGLINWDLLAVGLAMLAILAWAKNQPILAGVTLGISLGVAWWPLIVALALWPICTRAGKTIHYLKFLAALAIAGAVVQVIKPANWFAQIETSYGSIWYLLHLGGINLPATRVISAILIGATWLGIFWLAFTTSRRPRLGQLLYLIAAPLVTLGISYSPQNSLWILPLLILANPNWKIWAWFTGAEICYWAAIWGHLSKMLATTGEPSAICYPIAALLRIVVIAVIAYRCIKEIKNPNLDPVRKNLIDDPAAGPARHAPDAYPITKPAKISQEQLNQTQPEPIK